MKLFTSILLSLLAGCVCSQNLVNSPSFDPGLVPTGFDQISSSISWDPGNFDPKHGFADFFHPSASSPICGVPHNFAGYRTSDTVTAFVTGTFSFSAGYAGVVAYDDSVAQSRTFAAGDLINVPNLRLDSGVKHYFSMRVSLSKLSAYGTGLGLALGQEELEFPTNPVNLNTLHEATYYNFPIMDSGWVTLVDSFVPDKDYLSFAIGNTRFDGQSPIQRRDSCLVDFLKDSISSCPLEYAYYYIDNVCISTDKICLYPGAVPLASQTEVEAVRPVYKVWPVPSQSTVHTDYPGVFWLLDPLGRKVSGPRMGSVDLPAPPGMYLLVSDQGLIGRAVKL